MDQVPRLVYIVVFDNGENKNKKKKSERTPTTLYFRYTPPILQTTLQLMGCKARHAFKISRRVFEVMMRDIPGNAWPDIGMEVSSLDDVCGHNEKENGCSTGSWFGDEEADSDLVLEKDDKCSTKPFEFCKRRMSVAVERETFLDVVCGVLAEYKYVGPTQRADFILACRIRERKESVTVLLCGASGCGKSTLSSLLGSRLGITTVISTDSIRHMMRSFVDEEQNPLLWASTYQAGDYLDPMAVAEAKAKKKMKNVAQVFNPITDNEVSDEAAFEKSGGVSLSTSELISAKQMVIEGFKAQSKMVISSLDRLIAAWEERKESVVVEGVHLSLNFVMELMKKHPSVIPFLIYIANEDKHLERFAVRAKYMALDPIKNKYVKYIRNIRTIQEYLCKWADKHLVPKINNTNADRSVTIIHATVLSCLRRRKSGEYLYNPTTDTVPLIDEEYRNQCAANSLSSKRMFQLIKRKGSSRHLMALINTDGSVEKAWPLNTDHGNGISMYGRSLISKAETINLQFGHYGLSAWSSDIGGSSQILSADDWSTDGAESGSRYNEPIGEMEGSVDEESAMSDEEYENLAIRDSCWFDG